MHKFSILCFVAAISACGDDSSGSGGQGAGTTSTGTTTGATSSTTASSGPGAGGGGGASTTSGPGGGGSTSTGAGGATAQAACEAFSAAYEATADELGCGQGTGECAVDGGACDGELADYFVCLTAGVSTENCSCEVGGGEGGGLGTGGGLPSEQLVCPADCDAEFDAYVDCDLKTGGTGGGI